MLKPFFRDAQTQYYEPMLKANRAMRSCWRSAASSPATTQRVFRRAGAGRGSGPSALVYQSGVEDLFFAMERRLIEIAGAEYGGNLQLARSRNDSDMRSRGWPCARLTSRRSVTCTRFWLALLDFAGACICTRYRPAIRTRSLAPADDDGPAASPGICSHGARDTARLQHAYRTNNQSPPGAAALTGTGFRLTASRARLLGSGLR
ncbi:MAG: hypothetical protein IPM16_19195 [Chloroflexi bacterium]|nr:hypothetical protein [Chloroflexota bacterium]